MKLKKATRRAIFEWILKPAIKTMEIIQLWKKTSAEM